MLELIIGGSGSGKSEYAEWRTLELHKKNNTSQLIYIATMIPYGIESELKIKRHREMRKDKGFTTIEVYTDLKNIKLSNECTVLLDCISNLVANEMFKEEGLKGNILSEIIEGVHSLLKQCRNVIIVTNDIFLEGYFYEDTTIQYMNSLAVINHEMANLSDSVIEVVCGIPLSIKSN